MVYTISPMPIRCTFDAPSSPILGRAEGSLTPDCLVDYATRVARIGPRAAELLDLRGSDVSGVRGRHMHRLAMLVDSLYERPNPNPMAIVADDEVAYGLARIYQALRFGRRDIEVFRSMSEARSWITGSRRL